MFTIEAKEPLFYSFSVNLLRCIFVRELGQRPTRKSKEASLT